MLIISTRIAINRKYFNINIVFFRVEFFFNMDSVRRVMLLELGDVLFFLRPPLPVLLQRWRGKMYEGTRWCEAQWVMTL